MKTCSKCKEEKLTNNFYKNKAQKDGYDNQCKDCKQKYHEDNKKYIAIQRQDYRKEYALINKEKIAVRKQKYRIDNKEQFIDYEQRYRELNKEVLSIKQQEYRKANPIKGRVNSAKRRASKLNATPKWLTKDHLDQIEEFYKEAQRLKLETGDEYHVDHIVPLQGESVCGLHVPWNLQVIPAKENLSKHNKLLD